jgi:hypothetical protein
MTSDPKRLCEDPATSATVRHDLVRSIAAPLHEYDMERGLSRLIAVTAVGTATATVASTTKAATVASSAKAAWIAGLVKWGLWGSAAIVATGVSAHFIVAKSHPSDSVQSATPSVLPAAVAAPVGTRDVPAVAPASPALATESPPVDVAPPVPSQTVVSPRPGHAGRTRPHEGGDSPGASEPTTDESVAREVALLGRARAALTGDPAQALALTREGQRDFPRGVLGEEREAIAVLALVRLGRRSEGAARGQAFLSRFPHGPFTERVRVALGTLNAGTPR